MSTVAAVRYTTGRVHGTPWGVSHNEGAVEYPPGPWRISRALVSTWFERAPEFTESDVRPIVDKLNSVRPTYRVPAMAGAHRRHYYPDSDHRSGTDGGTSKVLDTFLSVDPQQDLLIEWSVDLDQSQRVVLARLLELLPYLGRAESIVDARLLDESEDSSGRPGVEVVPGFSDALDVTPLQLLAASTRASFTDLLDVPWKLRNEGHVLPPNADRVAYQVRGSLAYQQPQQASPAGERVYSVQWAIQGKGKIPVTAAVAFCEMLRGSVLSKVGNRFEDAGWVVTGKADGFRAQQGHNHAHFLPVVETSLGSGDSAMFITGLVAWFPAGIESDVADAVTMVEELRTNRVDGLRDFRTVQLFLERVCTATDASQLPLFQSSKVWRTVTPYAPARHLRYDNRFERSLFQQVTTELQQRDWASPFPEPIRVSVDTEPNGRPYPLDFRRHRVKEFLRDSRRAFHVTIEFDEPVQGPISIGALSHFGLGLFQPVLVGGR